jgi:hypothetical protein
VNFSRKFLKCYIFFFIFLIFYLWILLFYNKLKAIDHQFFFWKIKTKSLIVKMKKKSHYFNQRRIARRCIMFSPTVKRTRYLVYFFFFFSFNCNSTTLNFIFPRELTRHLSLTKTDKKIYFISNKMWSPRWNLLNPCKLQKQIS